MRSTADPYSTSTIPVSQPHFFFFQVLKASAASTINGRLTQRTLNERHTNVSKPAINTSIWLDPSQMSLESRLDKLANTSSIFDSPTTPKPCAHAPLYTVSTHTHSPLAIAVPVVRARSDGRRVLERMATSSPPQQTCQLEDLISTPPHLTPRIKDRDGGVTVTWGPQGDDAGEGQDNRVGDGAVASGSSNPVAPRDDEGIAAPRDSEKTTQGATSQRYHTRHPAQGIQACHSYLLGHSPAEFTHNTSACHPVRTAFASNADQSRGCKSRMPIARRPTCPPNTTQSFQQRKLRYAPRDTPARVAECAVDWARNLTRALVNGARPDPERLRSSVSGSPTNVVRMMYIRRGIPALCHGVRLRHPLEQWVSITLLAGAATPRLVGTLLDAIIV
ncbi:hypothetical protein BD779DRAFT_1472291 [Infundibulicybe gibba]|nr:hypothetical protein BD779DRAFT_1472291 [Infundibulicybe gibba]